MTQNTNEPLHIVGTDLLDYSFKAEKAVKEGYTFSDKNEYAPRAWPHMFEAWMVKSEYPSVVVIDAVSKKDLEELVELSKKDSKVNLLFAEAAQSPSVASESTSEGVGSQEGNKAVVGASKPVAKRGRKV